MHVPVWLGVGTSLDKEISEGRLELLRQMVREWPLFKTTLSHIEMVLGKADTSIASVYEKELVPDQLKPIGQFLRDELALVSSSPPFIL
jgi:phosphoenolpyruvate carboxylase